MLNDHETSSQDSCIKKHAEHSTVLQNPFQKQIELKFTNSSFLILLCCLSPQPMAAEKNPNPWFVLEIM
ncbi:hypothetical protein PO909_017915 [Leuciscus waleckii]